MNDEFPPTKSADEGDDDEGAPQEENESRKLYESAQEENEKQEAIISDTMNHAPEQSAPVNHVPMNHAPQLVFAPIQPYYPPYPQYPTNNGAVYIDQSLNLDPPADRRNRGGVTEPFPEKLHR